MISRAHLHRIWRHYRGLTDDVSHNETRVEERKRLVESYTRDKGVGPG